MKMRFFLSTLFLVCLFGSNASAASEIRADKTNLPMNRAVLKIAHDFKDGGAYNTKWTGSGTPERIEHLGERILAEGTGGTYCSGFTFNVAMKTAEKLGLLKGKSVDEVRKFQKNWYGAVSDKTMREKQCSLAVGELGIGKEVSSDEAQPGDFAQFWRSKSGHSVVFLGWLLDKDGQRTGLKYRSSQGSTNGIGNHIEYFNNSKVGKGTVDPSRIYFARFEK